MVSLRSFLPAAVLLGALQHVVAQTSTSCNPLNTTACPTNPAFGTDYNFIFNSTPPDDTWEITAGTVDYTDQGAEFTISQSGDSPTIRTKFYIFFGRVEMWLKAAPGQGIISSMMLLSDDLDEVDWEFLGGNGTAVETNYFGKGLGNYTWEGDYEVSGGTLDDYHNYTLHWTNETLEWHIDGSKVRSLTPQEANNTYSYPQTPMRVSVGDWAGGDPSEPKGTIEWAGGETDYTKGPFTMYVRSIRITDYGRGTAYNYTDMSGTWESIQEIKPEANSTAASAVDATPTQSLSDKIDSLSTGTKSAIYACSGAAAAALAGAAIFYIIRQRKRGAAEAAMAAQRQQEERLEMQRYKEAGINPDGFSDVTPEYDASAGMATRNVEVPVYGTDTYGAEAIGAAGAAAASRPLLNRERPGTSGSLPDSPHAQTPYSDGFSPIDHNGYGNISHQSMPPPTGPLPSIPVAPNRSFSSPMPNPQRAPGGEQPQRSFTNPNGGQQGQHGPGGEYWR